MPLASPTIVQPVSTCNDSISVLNLLVGAEIQILDSNGAPVSAVTPVTQPSMRITLTGEPDPSLSLVAVLSRQIPGGVREESRSRAVPVQPDAPELAAPIPLGGLRACISCLQFAGIAPGGRVVARIDGNETGRSISTTTGIATVNFDTAPQQGDLITFAHVQCGAAGESITLEVLQEETIAAMPAFVPSSAGTPPLKACAWGFTVDPTTLGAAFHLDRSVGLGGGGCLTGRSPTTYISLNEPLVADENLRFAMSYPLCSDVVAAEIEGDVVVAPPRRLVIVAPLCHGARELFVAGLEPGARIEIDISDEEVFETNSVPGNPIELPRPLEAGQQVTVRQFLCELMESSPTLMVDAAPAEVPPGRIEPPLLACASRVVADGLTPGASAEIVSRMLGAVSARVRVLSQRQGFDVFPALIEGDEIFLRQYACAGSDAIDGRTEEVERLSEFSTLEVIARAGDMHLTIDNAALGSRIDVRREQTWLGSGIVEAARGQRILLQRPLTIEDGLLEIVQTLCGVDVVTETEVLRPCPEPPMLVRPAEGASWVDFRRVQFEWGDPGRGTLAEAEGWSLVLSGTPADEGGSVHERIARGLRSPNATEDLQPFHNYTWTVTGRHSDCQDGTPSMTGRFRTRPDTIEFRLNVSSSVFGPFNVIFDAETVSGRWLLGTSGTALEPILISGFSTRSRPRVFNLPAPATDRSANWTLQLELTLSGQLKSRDGALLRLLVRTPFRSARVTFGFPPSGRTYGAECRLQLLGDDLLTADFDLGRPVVFAR